MGNSKRPQSGSTTPSAETVNTLLGSGIRYEGVVLTREETEHLQKLYGYKEEQPQKRPNRPVEPKRTDYGHYEYEDAIRLYKRQVKAWEQWEDSSKLMQAGADRNMLRHAAHDGLRIIAWLAKYVEPGQDPLKEIVKMIVDRGYDVEPSDVSWAEEEG